MEPSPPALRGLLLRPRLGRRLNRRWRKQRAFAALLVLPFVAVLALPAPVVQAQGALTIHAPNASPTGPCLLNLLLCGQNIVQNPAPCVLGLLCTPAPLPSPCVGGALLCGGGVLTSPGVVRPPNSVGPGGTTSPPARNPVTGTTATRPGQSAAPGAGQGPLLAPPGVGLVAPPAAAASTPGGPSPDALAVLLSLSIRDGLSVGSSSIWPWLAALQLLLLLGMLAKACSRQLTAASKPAS